MVDESDIRSHLVDAETPAIAINTDAIISRSKARRRPRQLAVGAVSVLAAASLVFAGVNTFPRTGDLTTAGSMADESSTRMDSDAGADNAESYLAPDAVMDRETCGAIIPSQAASPYGLALELDLPGPVTASGSAFGTVRLTNTSDVAVTGTTASVPDVNLTRDSVSISHSPDAQILSVIPVNLQPGQSIEFAVSLAIYDCTTIDTGGMVEPGIYTASTSLAFVPSDPEIGEAAGVRSSPSTIVLQ
ncbi:hypothetical protein [Salinibacterium sp. TMP30]|uniref:hypothetical protein n=1 Tax=Salinibacterium sp. TMP30 TaxID=3138237 RepID=UPI003138BA52